MEIRPIQSKHGKIRLHRKLGHIHRRNVLRPISRRSIPRPKPNRSRMPSSTEGSGIVNPKANHQAANSNSVNPKGGSEKKRSEGAMRTRFLISHVEIKNYGTRGRRRETFMGLDERRWCTSSCKIAAEHTVAIPS